MPKYLVIVESPTKARTISSILGKNYDVVSSMGHIVDLPARRLSVDVDNAFEPVFRVLPGKKKLMSSIKKKAKGKDTVYLATDPDREGEAISWHIKNCLSGVKADFKRVAFHEITDEALLSAFDSAGELDMDKVNAQIARRVLDRVVGYRLSPVLWKKIARGLSAGRVQSIALKFIVERERAILVFKPEVSYSIEAVFRSGEKVFKARLLKFQGTEAVFSERKPAEEALQVIGAQNFKINDILIKRNARKPPPPYTTSLMQQDSFGKLRFSANKTMVVAQQLYEGVDVSGKSTGLITYMRTDSFRVSPKAAEEVKAFILQNLGEEYLASGQYNYKAKKGAQEAHEAIRPTSAGRRLDSIAVYLSSDQAKLYDLIWKRFVCSFMKEAVYENTKVMISSDDCVFCAEGRRVVFDGFLRIAGSSGEDVSLEGIAKESPLTLEGLEIVEHVTKPPARYNDASLVRLLEGKGIGRPSTYAPTIQTLVKRNYAKRAARSLVPTELGFKVCDLLSEYFTQVMDESFTASMESQLDEVEKGQVKWQAILYNFYPSFNEKVEETILKVKKEQEFSDKKCRQCGGRLVYKWSRRGRFLSCEHFPACRYGEAITTQASCPDCKDGFLVERRNKRGQDFYGCSRFPECRYTSRTLPSGDNEHLKSDS